MILNMGTRARDLLKKRWTSFTRPYLGMRRTFAPWKWEWRDRILVVGESLAVGAAIAAVPFEIVQWSYAPWLIVEATIIGTSALLWYAFDLISVGESPLSNKSVKNIRAVIIAMGMEKEGVEFEWGNARKDSGIPMDISRWSKLSEIDMDDIAVGQPIKIAIGDTLIGTAKKPH